MLLLGMVGVGCTSIDYAGRTVEAQFTSAPPGATAFVLDNRVWLKDGWSARIAKQKDLQSDGNASAGSFLKEMLADLEPYRIKAGPTPVRHRVPQWTEVYVVVLEERLEYLPFNGMELTEVPDHLRVVHIALPEAKASP